MNIYTLGRNFEPHHRLLTGAGSGSRRQNGGFGGASVSYGKCKIAGVKLPDFTNGI